MSGAPLLSPKDPWFTGSILLTAGVFVLSAVAGFLVFPFAQSNFHPSSLWDAICSAAGRAKNASSTASVQPDFKVSTVVMTPGMFHSGASSIGRGATLAQQCAICHGPNGISHTNFPDLAGQYPDVVYKELNDFKTGARVNVTMTPFAQMLSEQQMLDLADYFSSLPRLPSPSEAPKIVMNGAPLRNIAPCGSCHGDLDHKIGTPWLAGQSAVYIKAQLEAFKSDSRRNDISEQMRNIARQLTPEEIDEAAHHYASQPPAQGERP